MKTVKILCLLSIVMLMFNCSSDDDDGQTQLTNQQLLTSGKWYQESKTPGNYTDCQKKGYVEFKTNGTIIINSYDDKSGTCESSGAVTANYTLTNNVNIKITLGSDAISGEIKSISSDKLTIVVEETSGKVTQVFDKTEG